MEAEVQNLDASQLANRSDSRTAISPIRPCDLALWQPLQVASPDGVPLNGHSMAWRCLVFRMVGGVHHEDRLHPNWGAAYGSLGTAGVGTHKGKEPHPIGRLSSLWCILNWLPGCWNQQGRNTALLWCASGFLQNAQYVCQNASAGPIATRCDCILMRSYLVVRESPWRSTGQFPQNAVK